MIRPKFSNFIFILLLFGVLTNSCAILGSQKKLTSKKVVRDGREMLYGKITLEQLFFDYPDWQKEYQSYLPQAKIMSQLKALNPHVNVIIFIGTWCSDSKREVPRFFKIIDQAHLTDKLKIEMWAVDRKKNLPNDLPQQFGIEYVPTFIFLKNGKEIGRIVESPEALYLEEDILNILNRL